MPKTRLILRHARLSLVFVILLLLLNRPEVIVVSRLGYVVWFPAAGLAVALMLGISPWYAPLVCLSGILAGKMFYHQPLATFGETIGAIGGAGCYAAAAYVLRGPLRIDPGLRRRRDVVRYVFLTTIAALGSTTIGVACLAADRTIRWTEYWQSASVWFLGDEIGLLAVAPFVLIHILPWVRKQLSPTCVEAPTTHRNSGTKPSNSFQIIEAATQALSLAVLLWVIFGSALAQFQLFFLSFIPIIWIAMRQGIRRVVSGLLALNFGIVVALHFCPATVDLLSKMGLLMFVVSALGLLVGSAVTERHRMAIELFERTAELQEANSQLLASKQKAEEGSRIKSEFLANMSHEIRTPINGILGMAELVLDTEITVEQRDYLSMLKSSADSLLRVINDILDFSKIESGKLELCPAEFNLQNTIGDAMKTLALQAHQKGLELAFHIAPGIPEYVLGDSGRVCQVLINLVGNAIKFTAIGEVIVHVQPESDGRLHFSVADTGIGIPPEKHALIFEAFSQADGSTTRNYGGTGLGLAISSQLVRLLGGQIWLESKEGEGSTFHFTVCLAPAQSVTKTSASVQSELKDFPLLVVDDNLANRRILTETAKSWGMRVEAVENGEAALRRMKEAEPNGTGFRLVIVDSCMPEMSGFDLAQRIRQAPALAGCKIIMLTSAGQVGDSVRCRELGIDAYLLKPAGKSELLRAVLRVLQSEPAAVSHPSSQPPSRNQRGPLRILVAEDNLVNQTVILHMLTRLGHVPTIAHNGQQAIVALQTGMFDLAFMDVQMPVMDGLTATRLIREAESKIGIHIPIIAMTAHAMKRDKQICLEAGMDAYIAKPATGSEIELVIANVLSLQHTPRNSSPDAISQPSASWDPLKALEKTNGNETLLRELIQIFLQESPKQMDKLSHAIEGADRDGIERSAHSLKGELKYLGLIEAAQQACEFERMGREGNFELATERLRRFQAEIRVVTAAMHRVLQAPQSVSLSH
jgi:signal transduction histidine kinase/DNA-binding response OmpR family regulator